MEREINEYEFEWYTVTSVRIQDKWRLLCLL